MRTLAILSFAFLITACGGKSSGDSANTGNPCANPCGNPCDNPCANPCGNPCGGGGGGGIEQDVSGWDTWTKINDERFESKGHNKSWVDIYVAGDAAEAVLAKTGPYAVGTKIVKAQYAAKDGGEPQALTVMVKMDAGYAAETGDWYWAAVDGGLTKAWMQGANVEKCTGCHTQAKDRDWVVGMP